MPNLPPPLFGHKNACLPISSLFYLFNYQLCIHTGSSLSKIEASWVRIQWIHIIHMILTFNHLGWMPRYSILLTVFKESTDGTPRPLKLSSCPSSFTTSCGLCWQHSPRSSINQKLSYLYRSSLQKWLMDVKWFI